MKTKIWAIILLWGSFTLISHSANGQIQQKKTRIALLGMNAGAMGVTFKGPYPAYPKYHAFGFTAEPFAGLFVHQNLAFGLTGSYSRIYSNFIQVEPIYDVGYWGRYIFPFGKKSAPKFGGTHFPRHLFFFQLSHRFSNAYVHRFSGSQVVRDNPNVQSLSPTLGASLRLKNTLFLELSLRQQYYLNVPGQHVLLGSAVGISYLLDPEDRAHEFRRPIQRSHQKFLRFLYRPAKDSLPDFKPFNRLIIGTNLTYIQDVAYLNGTQREGNKWHELTWHLNVATPISRKLQLGFDYLRIHTTDPFVGRQQFWMAGPTLQYDLLTLAYKLKEPDNRLARFYVELGGFRGNYCTCDPDNPYRYDGLVYVGMGLGADVRLNQWLHLDAGFTNYEILNRVLGKYNFTQYVLGVDVHLFGKSN